MILLHSFEINTFLIICQCNHHLVSLFGCLYLLKSSVRCQLNFYVVSELLAPGHSWLGILKLRATYVLY